VYGFSIFWLDGSVEVHGDGFPDSFIHTLGSSKWKYVYMVHLYL